HTVIASFLTVSFLLAGLSAYRWLRNDRTPAVAATLKAGIYMAAVLAPLQVVVGDLHGLNTLEHQPAKIAAMEGLWETREGAPLVLFALPDEATQSNRFAIEIPKLASLILTHDPNGELRGLDAFEGAAPSVAPVFWSFRIMVGTGVAMLLLSWVGAVSLLRRGQLPPLVARAFAWMSFSGWLAVLAGWYTTEIGRQPFLVSGVLRTADAVTATPPAAIGITLAGYLVVYAVLMVSYVSVVFYLARQAGLAQAKQGEPVAHGPAVLPLGSRPAATPGV
ncbi:MAG: cytochrome ubiquinol oxidase subunit I, partial [Pseudomonadota bacterium]